MRLNCVSTCLQARSTQASESSITNRSRLIPSNQHIRERLQQCLIYVICITVCQLTSQFLQFLFTLLKTP